jgi:uncharacterized repeat protein (TIGR03803 family)
VTARQTPIDSLFSREDNSATELPHAALTNAVPPLKHRTVRRLSMIRPPARNLVCAVFAIFALLAVSAQAQTYQSILTFNTNGETGSYGAYSTLVQATGGLIYGTGYQSFGQYAGSVYAMTADGTETMAYRFCSELNCRDGFNPQGNVVEADGVFFGITAQGGANSNKNLCSQGCGTVYRITPEGELTTLYSFCSLTNCADGAVPLAGLVEGVDGYLYGTTSTGGTGGGGTIFRITPDGDLITLYRFCSIERCADGSMPNAPLLQAPGGNFYGTTPGGGKVGRGTIFQMTPDGVLTTVHNFCTGTCHNGFAPSGGLTLGAYGNLYGTTSESLRGHGTVYKFSSRGKFTTLYKFCFERMDCSNGLSPETGVTLGSDGYLYGTTPKGGDNQGTIFAISPSGDFHRIRGFYTGGTLEGGLLQDTNGFFYGYCLGSGGSGACVKDDSYGNIFVMDMHLKPFVKMNPTFGPAGAAITILGTRLQGATSVTFNGVPATFTVVSASQITTTVPAGATTGQIEVTTGSGTLKSNLPFTATQ